MTRRPLVRVSIPEQCPICGRRSRPGGALCLTCYRARLSRWGPYLGMGVERVITRAETLGAFESPPRKNIPPAECCHGFDDWVDCPACVAVADFDDGEEPGVD